MFYTNISFYTHFETQNNVPISVSLKRSGHVSLRCTLGMRNKQVVFVDGTVLPASNVCYYGIQIRMG